MLHRQALPLLLALSLACDAVMADPNTSAPRTRNLGEYTRLCDERMDAIRDWENKQERRVEDEWIDQRRGIWQSAAKLERVREEAQSMRRELRDNCEANKPDPGIAAERLGIPDCIDADVLNDIQAEYKTNATKTEGKYVGQRLCVRGKVTGASEGTAMGNITASVNKLTTFHTPYYKTDGRRPGWVSTLNRGQVIEAECTVGSVAGIVTFQDCEFAGGR